MRRNYPRPFLAEEMRLTAGNPTWREDLLKEVGSSLGKWKGWATKVGTGKNEMQIRFVEPIAAQFSFPNLNLRWVQFRTLQAQTKHDTTQVVRFGPDTAVTMVLVKVPYQGSFKWLMLARRKYQFAGKDLFIEINRGWGSADVSDDQHGLEIFKRDYPGFAEQDIVKSVTHHLVGTPVWENNAQYANMISYHLVVVELKGEIGNEQLQKLLVEEKIKQEYPGEKLEDFEANDLVSCPIVFDLPDAARYLNAHLNGKPEKLAFFGENYSIAMWSRFLSLYGNQFPSVLPDPEAAI